MLPDRSWERRSAGLAGGEALCPERKHLRPHPHTQTSNRGQNLTGSLGRLTTILGSTMGCQPQPLPGHQNTSLRPPRHHQGKLGISPGVTGPGSPPSTPAWSPAPSGGMCWGWEGGGGFLGRLGPGSGQGPIETRTSREDMSPSSVN